jgi:O-antigen ligase
VFLKTYPIAFMCPALIITITDFRKLVYTLTAAGFCVFMVGWLYGRLGADGRFMIPFGSMSNPNDLATHILVVLPLFLIAGALGGKLIRVATSLCALEMTYLILKTASRAALLATAVMVILLILHASGAQKIFTVFAALAVIAISVAVLPSTVWSRFQTIYSDDSDDAAYGVSSRESRKEIARRAMWATVTHPLFGVGPGTFMAFDAGQATEGKAMWAGTHNSYLQVSAEAGLPGLLFFTGAVVSALRSYSRIRKAIRGRADMKELRTMSLFLFVGVCGFATDILFAHVAYRYYVPIILGMSMSFTLIFEAKTRVQGPFPATATRRLPVSTFMRRMSLQKHERRVGTPL